MVLHFDTDNFETLQIGILPEECIDAERIVCDFALAISTLTIKFMQDNASLESHVVLKEVLCELYEDYLDNWMNQSNESCERY